ncbi:response regulator, partial [Arsukibacterium sp.]|uniref:response regulator n=1 Tax=Arsukibacterium sp. TaxID=1977258 RepID=UPI002FDB819B
MQKTILLVDDEVNILKALERLLRRSGYTVLTAESGFAALELMAQHDCHVVISDFRMPGMTGDQLLLNIKQDFPQCICMVLSGFADFNAVIGLLNSGSAFRFLQKPWDDDALLIEIELAFEEYHKRRNKKIRNQFLLSSREALLEVTMTGQLCRSNATAQQLLSMSGTELAVGNVSQLFSDLDTELLTQLLSRQKMGVQCQHQTRAIEVDVQMSDKHFALLRLQLAEELPLLVDSTVNLPQVLNQNGLIRKIYSLLQTNKTSALVALQIKDYHLINDIIGFVEAEQLFENIAGSLLSSMSKYGCLGYLA